MKSFCCLLLVLTFLSACNSPQYFAQKGNYDKAFDGYSAKLISQKTHQKNEKDLNGLESAFALAQHRDSTELALLYSAGKSENWPRINALHRQIKTRQKTVNDLMPLKGRKGYIPKFVLIKAIDSLQNHSRHQAAAYLYGHAQSLLAETETTGQRQPARDAYYALRDLKANYYPYWENTNCLIDSAYQAGKAHILFETSIENGVSDGRTFWESASLKPNFIKNEWLVFYNDSTARKAFDYRAKCRLVSLDVGSENNSSTERTETKQVEDGYEETMDSSGRIVSRTVKYKTETITITTYRSSRSAYGAVVLELIDEHTRKTILTQSIQGSHNFDETSETCSPSAPSYWGMIDRVVSVVEWDLRAHLKKALGANSNRSPIAGSPDR